MSRVGKSPINVPSGVDVSIQGNQVTVKGTKGQLNFEVDKSLKLTQEDNELVLSVMDDNQKSKALSGTTRALVNNMVVGVSSGFTKTLSITGVGYRAAVSGNTVNLTLGFSHPIAYSLPDGISAETPNNTTIVISGIDKQRVGQVAAEIRAFRPPEPYKGKGVRYADEFVRRKEAKKK